MTRRTLCALSLVATACAAVVGTASAASVIQSRGRVSPGPHLFGDRIDVVVDVIVDSTRIDPSSVRVEASFAPYEPFGKSSRKQTSDGHLVRITFRFPVACLSILCVPGEHPGISAVPRIVTEKRIAFPPARVRYVGRKGRRHTTTVAMPSVRLVTRAPADIRTPTAGVGAFRDPIVALRAPTRTLHTSYRAAPTLVGSVFLGSAALVFAVALVLAWPALLHVYGVLRPVVTAPSTTPLEEALARVELASAEEPGTAAHREALARLMRELRAGGLDELVEPARRLAWSAESPTLAASRELSDRVRQAVAVRS